MFKRHIVFIKVSMGCLNGLDLQTDTHSVMKTLLHSIHESGADFQLGGEGRANLFTFL